jgi:hypothetical protein
MPVVAITQPYMGKRRLDTFDTNTDPHFNQITSSYALVSQAQAAAIKLQNIPLVDYATPGTLAGAVPATADLYNKPTFVTLPLSATTAPAGPNFSSATSLDYKGRVDNVIAALAYANLLLSQIIVDANPK